jgi:hypothetical protein
LIFKFEGGFLALFKLLTKERSDPLKFQKSIKMSPSSNSTKQILEENAIRVEIIELLDKSESRFAHRLDPFVRPSNPPRSRFNYILVKLPFSDLSWVLHSIRSALYGNESLRFQYTAINVTWHCHFHQLSCIFDFSLQLHSTQDGIKVGQGCQYFLGFNLNRGDRISFESLRRDLCNSIMSPLSSLRPAALSIAPIVETSVETLPKRKRASPESESDECTSSSIRRIIVKRSSEIRDLVSDMEFCSRTIHALSNEECDGGDDMLDDMVRDAAKLSYIITSHHNNYMDRIQQYAVHMRAFSAPVSTIPEVEQAVMALKVMVEVANARNIPEVLDQIFGAGNLQLIEVLKYISAGKEIYSTELTQQRCAWLISQSQIHGCHV